MSVFYPSLDIKKEKKGAAFFLITCLSTFRIYEENKKTHIPEISTLKLYDFASMLAVFLARTYTAILNTHRI